MRNKLMEVRAKINRQRKMLIIEVPLQKAAPSKHSGKTLVVATTHGCKTTKRGTWDAKSWSPRMPSCTRRRQRRRRSTEKTPSKALCAV